MAYYPVNLRLAGRECIVVGGGAVAERKAASLLAAGARVTVLSPAVTPALAGVAAAGAIIHIPAAYHPGAIRKFFYRNCATDAPLVNSQAAPRRPNAPRARQCRRRPDGERLIVPACVARGDLLLTVSTGGKSPALAARLRRELAGATVRNYGQYLDLARPAPRRNQRQPRHRRRRGEFWREALGGEILALLKAGKVRERGGEDNRCS
jgi:precorrin-2 dehydrogenase/sirohydrochlorin ferrochelatase